MTYRFYGWETADVMPVTDEYPGIGDPCTLYDALDRLWCMYTCTPRMRRDWNENNKTLGQCAITAFLAQDIYGGQVYGIELSDGSVHCFNKAGDCVFDLTSEQFREELCYEDCKEQFRKVHFKRQEKQERYAFLKEKLYRFTNRKENPMNIVCLDMEGVLVPEIWIAFSEASGIPELRRTTRDEPDYDKLMKWRIGILKEHGLGLKEIQETIAKIDPLPGAKEFLDELRSMTQVVILSDTFEQFAMPLMKKLGYPSLFCNTLQVADNGEITGFTMRCEKSKLTTVKALQSIGFDTIASGDSYNDLDMILASKAGFLFRSTEQIKKDYPQIPAFEEFDDLLDAIKKAL